MVVNAGELRHKIDIQENDTGTDDYGEPSKPPFSIHTNLRASFITTGGKELYAAQKVNALTEGVFKLRYVPGITADMRVKFGNRYFNILLVNNVNERNEWLLLSVREVV
jgi:SPP1 family predicted phage head-tail adaptor